MRKIIQFQITDQTQFQKPAIVALCYDGTVWMFSLAAHTPMWEQLPPIPEDGDKDGRKFIQEWRT